MTAPSLFGDSDTFELASPQSEEVIRPVPSTDTRSGSTSSLYRKHRPQSFDVDELVGQEHIVRTLRNAIALDRIAHAYLFSGPRGTGKTTTARLLAKAINCLENDAARRPCNACANCEGINVGTTSDVVEIDAASNRGIDDIRDLRERVRYAPTQLQSKVYIIDEAHQITGAAANAFLKTLEEPPAHTRFILATTDPEELLPTIVSRCQRFEFRRVNAEDMTRRLRTVSDLEGIAIETDALSLIARHATGSLRDALGLLEQLSLQSGTATTDQVPAMISVSEVTAALGLSRNDRVESLVEAISARDAGRGLRIVQDAVDDGEDARQLNRQLLSYLRLLLFVKAGGAPEADTRARELAEALSLGELAALARRFGEIDFSIKHAPFPQLPLEVALVESTAHPPVEQSRGTPPEQQSGDKNTSSSEASGIRPTSLRDRVRAPSAIREVSTPVGPVLSSNETALITPLRPPAGSESAVHAKPVPSSASSSTFDVEHIAEMWPNVRADVKALNRRVEALLSEVDPVAISGNLITLAVPYPFHRDKLNSNEVRELVGGVLSRLLGQQISLTCILRGEMATVITESRAISEQVEAMPQAPPPEDGITDEEERARVRLRAAMNIFDAEEIVDSGAASQPIQAGES